jgi:hypothetical protein
VSCRKTHGLFVGGAAQNLKLRHQIHWTHFAERMVFDNLDIPAFLRL